MVHQHDGAADVVGDLGQLVDDGPIEVLSFSEMLPSSVAMSVSMRMTSKSWATRSTRAMPGRTRCWGIKAADVVVEGRRLRPPAQGLRPPFQPRPLVFQRQIEHARRLHSPARNSRPVSSDWANWATSHDLPDFDRPPSIASCLRANRPSTRKLSGSSSWAFELRRHLEQPVHRVVAPHRQLVEQARFGRLGRP